MKLLAGGLVLAFLAAFGMVGFVVILTPQNCATLVVGVTEDKVPDPLTTYTGDERANAMAVVAAGAVAGVPARGQTVALMAAIYQSDLVNADYDPLIVSADYGGGIFQATDASLWGSHANRMDPAIASATFYRLLLAIPDWQSMELTAAAAAVLPLEDPLGYASAYGSAVGILSALSNTAVYCEAGLPGVVNDYGWARPAAGIISGGFGPRAVICTAYRCSSAFHTGTDLQNTLGTPIYAAYGGQVIQAGSNGSFGYSVTIDHENGVTTFYGHMDAGGIYVHVGDAVYAGQNIAIVGCSGMCTGPHVHFEVRVRGVAVDPVPFMQLVGVQLG